MATRLFLVPRAGSGTNSDPYRPKYADEVERFSGGPIDGSEFDPLPNRTLYVCRFRADEATLDQIQSSDDAHTLETYDGHRSDVVAFLNDRAGYSRTFEEWMAAFGVSG